VSFPRHPTRTARDAARLRLRDELVYRAIRRGADLSGAWKYPIPTSGDLADMTFLDKMHWLYKSERPIERAVRGSDLEAFFEAQRRHRFALPDDFAVETELTLGAVGDLMNHELLGRSERTLYRDAGDVVFGADLSMGNLECVVVDDARGSLGITMEAGAALHFEPDTFDVVGRRFDFLATACNHSLDFGAQGVASTIAALNARGIAFHGINERDEDASKATILERKGIRVGVVAWTFGLNGHAPPPGRPRIVNVAKLDSPHADLGLVEEQLQHCKEASVDFTIAQLHWGLEFERYPRPEQRVVAHRLAEMGVDAIVGHHPHVVQPVEHYRTERDPARVVPIYYSLGNLTNPFTAPFMCRSAVARVRLAKGRSRGRLATYVAGAETVELEQVADDASRTLSLRIAAP
jgi:poly-gamma-glutamate synthesis protein (capsule biosynthesis protein)